MRAWRRGAGTALAAMLIYAGSLMSLTALTLLVITMEEDGQNLSASTMDITSAMILLTQGSGFATGSLRLTLMPWLLTILLILLIRALAIRLRAEGIVAYVGAALTWLLLNLLIARSLVYTAVDGTALIAVKTMLVLSVAFALTPAWRGWMRRGLRRLGQWLSQLRLKREDGGEHGDRPGTPQGAALVASIHLGWRCGLAMLACLGAAGIISMIIWIVAYGRGASRLFELTGMGLGSQIMTTLASAAWLPNLSVWAIAWLTGSGFVIGDLGTFTMWTGQTSGLPPIPAFGMLPGPLGSDTFRTLLVVMPLILGFTAGLIVMLTPSGFDMTARFDDVRPFASPRTVLTFALPALALVIAGCTTTLASALGFWLSGGSLGYGQLGYVGAITRDAIRPLGHSLMLGLMLAWLTVLVGVGAHAALGWWMRRISAGGAVNHTKPANPHNATDHTNKE